MMMSTPSISKRKFQYKFWLLLTCLIGSLLFLLFQGGKLASMLFAIMAVVSIYLALGRWSGITQIRGKRTLDGVSMDNIVPAGTVLTIRIQTEIPGFWPIPYVLVKDRLVRKNGHEVKYESSFVPDWRRKGQLEYNTTPMRRGYYHFGSTDCTTEDVFGIFEHAGNLKMTGSFGVKPEIIPIKEWRQYRQLMKGMHQHSATNRALRETTQINGVREYHYGDRLSRIHWNATAKTGQFKSKEFERESLPKSILVLDRNKAAYKNNDQFELAVSITASLLEFASRKDIALGLLSVGKTAVYFDPSHSATQHRLMLHHLIDVEADGKHSLDQVLQSYSRSFASGSFFAFVSPQANDSMARVMDWAQIFEMIPCHFWLTGMNDKDNSAQWLSKLHVQGITGYGIQSLDELPRALEVHAS